MHNRFASTTVELSRRHHQRLHDLYRSAGRLCQDMLEVELLAAGMLERIDSASGHQIVRVTDSGLTRLAHGFARNKVRCTPHEALVEKLALEMARARPVVWRGLSWRAKVRAPERLPDAEAQSPSRWCVACPDVVSTRDTAVQAYLEPIVHAIKARRADLLGDLKKSAKRAARPGIGGECWYVGGQTGKGPSIARPDEIMPAGGVMLCEGDRLVVGCPAPRGPQQTLPFRVWMSPSKGSPLGMHDASQALLQGPVEAWTR